ncbi:unnamed protein product [Caenorhabditis sp. 36 PRJEB53466]|nr:unnamed protein product [Caenorhabditis sp. 36 PRJEB53466]
MSLTGRILKTLKQIIADEVTLSTERLNEVADELGLNPGTLQRWYRNYVSRLRGTPECHGIIEKAYSENQYCETIMQDLKERLKEFAVSEIFIVRWFRSRRHKDRQNGIPIREPVGEEAVNEKNAVKWKGKREKRKLRARSALLKNQAKGVHETETRQNPKRKSACNMSYTFDLSDDEMEEDEEEEEEEERSFHDHRNWNDVEAPQSKKPKSSGERKSASWQIESLEDLREPKEEGEKGPLWDFPLAHYENLGGEPGELQFPPLQSEMEQVDRALQVPIRPIISKEGNSTPALPRNGSKDWRKWTNEQVIEWAEQIFEEKKPVDILRNEDIYGEALEDLLKGSIETWRMLGITFGNFTRIRKNLEELDKM